MRLILKIFTVYFDKKYCEIDWFYSPRIGGLLDVCGVLSDRISTNTENAKRIATPNDSFSPESEGIKKVNDDRRAKTTVGMMTFNM